MPMVRRFRKRRRVVRRRHRHSLIARAVRASLRAQLRRTETQHAQYTTNTTNLDFVPGDGTSTVAYVMNPWAGVLISSSAVVGTASHAIVLGTKIFLRGVQLKARIKNANNGQTRVDIYMISAKEKTWPNTAGVTGWDKYINTTTATANPARPAGQSNIVLFESSVNGGYTGVSSSSDFDTNNIKIIKRKSVYLNNYGVAANATFKIVNVWFPINKFVKLEDPDEANPNTAPVFFKWRQYYFVIRVFTGAATDISNVSGASVDTGQVWFQPYWKNEQ